MDKFWLLHLVYVLALGGIFVRHVVYPWHAEHAQQRRGQRLRALYNHKVRELAGGRPETELVEDDRAVLAQLREVVTYHHYVEMQPLAACIASPRASAPRIGALYRQVREELGRAHPVFLHYSLEANIGLFGPLLASLVVISLTNIKALYQ